ncbi:uncharacterized protein MEPE_05462 [Melanopsichium pennsylvanicum]|uniref:Fe2OG dioxygenase domain-containing protein n=2 Tax=Melanopsichium pennsylvanicum TaxID=63383 RepID=A0AAJ4XTB8_9BASI|nr:uncharacterized conserved protein [Melanopsichium pennsylvanicum 4]SNX86753.1 uncharacterized protein MEPE_05462 [Melanopsichium pennsylvanicum]
MNVDDGSSDSLFGSDVSQDEKTDQHSASHQGVPTASRLAPSISGMFFFPDLMPRHLHNKVLEQVSACDYFALDDGTEGATAIKGRNKTARCEAQDRSPRNQAMLFARSIPSGRDAQDNVYGLQDELQGCSGLPGWAVELIQRLEELLTSLPEPQLPHNVRQLIFPANQLLSRQLIINLYTGMEGLASHVDLVHRFADGIVLCSFGPQNTGTVMEFTHAKGSHPPCHLFLPSGSVLLLSGEARYDWKHGISARKFDLVRSATCPEEIDEVRRSIRLSITIRSMLPGADVVGG